MGRARGSSISRNGCFDEYGLSVAKQILSRELRALRYRKLSARPRRHTHDEAAVVALERTPGRPGGVLLG
jgi:hypothetical protein